MSLMQILATILFFVVFIELFIALTLYIVMSIRSFLQKERVSSLLPPSSSPPL